MHSAHLLDSHFCGGKTWPNVIMTIRIDLFSPNATNLFTRIYDKCEPQMTQPEFTCSK